MRFLTRMGSPLTVYAKFAGHVRRISKRAAVKLIKFNQMSGEKLQMSGEAKKDFAYTALKGTH